MWAPWVISWFITPVNYIVRSTVNHREIGVMFTNLAKSAINPMKSHEIPFFLGYKSPFSYGFPMFSTLYRQLIETLRPAWDRIIASGESLRQRRQCPNTAAAFEEEILDSFSWISWDLITGFWLGFYGGFIGVQWDFITGLSGISSGLMDFMGFHGITYRRIVGIQWLKCSRCFCCHLVYRNM